MGNQNSTTGKEEAELTMREAMLPSKLRAWRAKLRVKAKQEKRYRFYSLYGLISHPETLQAAWAKVRANDGTCGVDGVSIEQVIKEGEEAFLKQLEKELREKTYRTGAVRRVYIPKANGKQRPLGIPNLRDRVVQTAVLLILEPIYEVDFMDCSFGFRPGRNAHGALEMIREQLKKGRCEIYDADLAEYFDSIPHPRLMACVRMRVVDGSVLRLIQQWLNAPIEEETGRRRRPPEDKGTPQGGVISPLLANIYLHWFDHVFHGPEGPARKAGAVLVRYADDFVVLARRMGGGIRSFIEGKLESWLGLKLNREKTRVVNLHKSGATLDFLGYSFRFDRGILFRASRFLTMNPSKASLSRERDQLRKIIGKSSCHESLPSLIGRVNRHLQGWANYFCVGYNRRAFRHINHFVVERLRRHLRQRSQRPWKPPHGQTVYAHLQQQGLKLL